MTSDQLSAMAREAAVLGRSGRREDAEASAAIYRRLVGWLPRDPVLAYNLATNLLSLGNYAEGFRYYEARAYLGRPNVVKPEYRPAAVPLAPETAATWGCQTIGAEEIIAFIPDALVTP